MNLERFGFLGISRNFSASIGSFQGLPAETSEVILLSQRLALKYNTTPRCSCQHFLTSFFQILCGGARLPQSKPDGFASSLGEGASGVSANFALQPETVPSCQRPHPRGRLPPLRGKMSRSDKKGNLSPQATGGVFPAASSPHPPPKALRIGGGCAIIYYIHYRALRKEP